MPVQFIEALIADLSVRARDDITLLPFVAQLVKAGRNGFLEQPVQDPRDPPAFFERASEAIVAPDPLKEAVAQASETRNWKPVVSAHPTVDPALSDGLFALHVAGLVGVLGAENVRCGVFALGPNLHYPAHTHVATELYYCVSGSIVLQHGLDGAPFPLQAGNYSVTPTGRLHSLTTGDEPALIIFVWVGDFDHPIYWWAEDADGSWSRNPWERDENMIWAPGPAEAVTSEMMAAQMLNSDGNE